MGVTFLHRFTPFQVAGLFQQTNTETHKQPTSVIHKTNAHYKATLTQETQRFILCTLDIMQTRNGKCDPLHSLLLLVLLLLTRASYKYR